MRVNTKDLELAVERLNKMTGSPLTPYTKLKNGKYKPNAKCYLLSWAYGGVSLHRMCDKGTGEEDVLRTGHVTKRELYKLIHAYMNGICEVTK